MILDSDVIQLVRSSLTSLQNNMDPSQPLPVLFARGIVVTQWKDQHPGACTRHKLIFDQFNIIPKYCFRCFKVKIEPQTVMQHLKLMMIFEQLKLDNDNSRKCFVELRGGIAGTYGGLIYCTSLEEGNTIAELMRKIVSKSISEDINITVKRGCSEYAESFPEYAKVEQDKTFMNYKSEWQKTEDLVDNKLSSKPWPVHPENNHPSYTLNDAKAMLAWLRYAQTIGDMSYLPITGGHLSPLPGVNRPISF